ncbi:MAG TPA: hypothetical protein VF470_08370 [Sphingomicrobium sp.]
MAIGNDDPISLPKAPPPRPAARQAAIEAALRKFDGVEEAAPARAGRERPGLFGWASTHRGPASALATAAIVAVVGLPIALATLRDSPRPAPQPPAASIAAQPTQEATGAADNLATFEPSENQVAADQAPSEPQAAARQAQPRPAPMALAPVAQKVADEEPAPAMAAAPPPPPPPPPPSPAPEREGYAAESGAQDMVVTGSRIRSPDLSDRANRQVAVGKSSPLVTVDTYGDFLSRLQSGVRADNRRAVSKLVGFPLTVNTEDGAKTYRSRREVETDFDRIFTPAVKAEILGLKPYSLRTGDDGRTKGSPRLWFSPACFNAECSPPGPIRIRDVTP